MKSKNCQKVELKALGQILYGSNFIASDVMISEPISFFQVQCAARRNGGAGSRAELGRYHIDGI